MHVWVSILVGAHTIHAEIMCQCVYQLQSCPVLLCSSVFVTARGGGLMALFAMAYIEM